jgi:hypothetical protein
MTAMSSKLGPPTSTNRNQATVLAPGATALTAETTSDLSTFLTTAVANGQPQVLYNGDRQQANVTLTLETAGPVTVSTRAALKTGHVLQTGVPTTIPVAKGNRLYVAASGINRISVDVVPVPWQEQQAGLLAQVVAGLGALLNVLARGVK